MIFILLYCGVSHVGVIKTVHVAASAKIAGGITVRQKLNPGAGAKTASTSVTVEAPKKV